jgi:hypothetical protein
MTVVTPPSASTAAQPDLDWSQVRETILMLGLAISQIEMAMKDSGESVDMLANSFTTMFAQVQVIADVARTLQDAEARQSIETHCGVVGAKMQEAIVAFQFYDRLVQRLSHVCHSVDALADLIADSARLYNPHEWFGMQQKIRSKYTMEEEKLMFDAIMEGKTVKAALALYLERKAQAASAGTEVELF